MPTVKTETDMPVADTENKSKLEPKSEAEFKLDNSSFFDLLSGLYTIVWKDRSFLVTRNIFISPTGDRRADKATAIARAQQFCTRTGFKFVDCQPFLTSLEEIESRMQY